MHRVTACASRSVTINLPEKTGGRNHACAVSPHSTRTHTHNAQHRHLCRQREFPRLCIAIDLVPENAHDHALPSHMSLKQWRYAARTVRRRGASLEPYVPRGVACRGTHQQLLLLRLGGNVHNHWSEAPDHTAAAANQRGCVGTLAYALQSHTALSPVARWCGTLLARPSSGEWKRKGPLIPDLLGSGARVSDEAHRSRCTMQLRQPAPARGPRSRFAACCADGWGRS